MRMVSRKHKPFDWGNLRSRAEDRLRERKEAANRALRDPEPLVHELEVHQMELEIQNEELREARLDLEAALARYTEIFDFAPIGYAAINPEGKLTELNHAAARILGGVRSQLLGKSLALLVPSRHANTFSELIRQTLVSEARECCELELLRSEGRIVAVRLMAVLLARAEPLILLTIEELRDGRPALPSITALRAPKLADEH